MPKKREKQNFVSLAKLMEGLGALGITKVTEIAPLIGVRRETLQRYKKKHPELDHAQEAGKAKTAYRLKQRDVELAMQGDMTAMKIALRNLTDWSTQDSTVNVTQTTTINSNFPLAERLKEARKRRDDAIAQSRI